MLTFSLIDDAGKSIEGAEVRTSTFSHWQPGEGIGENVNGVTQGVTDPHGLYVLTTTSLRGEFTYGAFKQGYYDTKALKYKFDRSASGRWEPWNAGIKIELNRVLNPIPLMAKLVAIPEAQYVPLPAKRVGYDFEVGDWVSPYGRGQISDVIFQLEGQFVDDTSYDTTMSVLFSNPGDGLVFQERNIASKLSMPHHAPDKGYVAGKSWHKTRVKGPDIGLTYTKDKLTDDTKSVEDYFLRVRTQLDEKGEVVSANYAKVRGGFLWYPNGLVKFQYYFNPTPNDYNLEFDSTRNLLQLSPNEKVIDP